MMKTIAKKLSAVRLAVGLILFIAILSLVGIFVPQAPSAMTASREAYAWWVDNIAYGKLGELVYTLEPLGLFHVFRSAWFLGASALLVLNILLCTVSRLGALRAKAEKAKIQTAPDFYQGGKSVVECNVPTPAGDLAGTASHLLEDRNYAIVRTDSTEGIFLAGGKRRFSSYGTLFVHLSLILLIIGIAVGAAFGFKDDSLVVSEGTVTDIGHQTGLSVYLESFADTYWDNGAPKDYRSRVVLYENGQTVKSGTVRVNHPLTYKGIRLHQGFFGQAVKLTVADASGAVVYEDTVPLTEIQKNESVQRPQGEAQLPDKQYHVLITGHAAAGGDTTIGENQVGIEFYDQNNKLLGWLLLDEDVPQRLGDLSFSFENLQYSGFMVSREPGANFVWIAAALFLLGLGMVFYFPYRRVWIRLLSASEGGTIVSVRFDSNRELGLGNESSLLLNALGLPEKEEGD